jgi:RimJ/RimL family protein N-acetyltransferase
MTGMNFSYSPLKIRSDSLIMDYFLVPWDTEITGWPVAEISRFEIVDLAIAKNHYSKFSDWCESQSIELCSCRINHDRLIESNFLQENGFRFIELNYRPELLMLQKLLFSSDPIKIEVALHADQDELAQMAGKIFQHGRFHQDPSIGSEIGNKRYETWLRNSFSNPTQSVYKCLIDEQIVAFFVVEYSKNKHVHWSLIGLAPGHEGRGIGTRVWQAMMQFHKNEGMASIGTSISSHNIAVLNLYVKLGFRFPLPQASFHWRPQEPQLVT